MITVSEAAQKKIEQFFEQNKDAFRSIRVFLHEGG